MYLGKFNILVYVCSVCRSHGCLFNRIFVLVEFLVKCWHVLCVSNVHNSIFVRAKHHHKVYLLSKIAIHGWPQKEKKNGHNINFREHMIRNTWMKAHVSAMRYMLSGLGHRPVGIGERLHWPTVHDTFTQYNICNLNAVVWHNKMTMPYINKNISDRISLYWVNLCMDWSHLIQ